MSKPLLLTLSKNLDKFLRSSVSRYPFARFSNGLNRVEIVGISLQDEFCIVYVLSLNLLVMVIVESVLWTINCKSRACLYETVAKMRLRPDPIYSHALGLWIALYAMVWGL